MRSSLFLLLALLALPSAAGKKIVATTADLGALAREVAGSDARVEVLAPAALDPHHVDARPSLVLSLRDADLLLLTGMELEGGWLPPILTTSRNGRIQRGGSGHLDCSTLITPREQPTAKLDRAMGDVHPGGNPHYTKDPRNGIAIAKGIARRLAELDAAHAAGYFERAGKLEAGLTARIQDWERQLAPHRGKPIVTYHRSWTYFTEWAGLEQVAYLEPKPGLDPSAAHVAQVIQRVINRKVPILLQEDWYESGTSQLVAAKGGAKVVRVPGMPREGERYEAWIDSLVDAVRKALPAS